MNFDLFCAFIQDIFIFFGNKWDDFLNLRGSFKEALISSLRILKHHIWDIFWLKFMAFFQKSNLHGLYLLYLNLVLYDFFNVRTMWDIHLNGSFKEALLKW